MSITTVKADIKIKIGNSQDNVYDLPTVVAGGTPYISWVLPEGMVQARFNLRMKSTNTFAEFIYGETASPYTYVQWPLGYAMNDNWLGTVHIEVLISANATMGQPFEFTSGAYEDMDKTSLFVYDTIAENIYNSDLATYRWRPSTDINFGQNLVYNLQVATHPLFTSEILVDKMVNSISGSFVFTQDVIEIGTTYFWRVRAYDGLDYSDWTKQNGFKVINDVPPTITILEILPLNNEYGDVLITFNVEDLNDFLVSVICTYSGGTVSYLTPVHCSMINNLHEISNGVHTVIWRSSRDEKLIEASDYMIYMQAWDGLMYGELDSKGPFHLDNRLFGIPSGGIGAIDIDFPIINKMVKKTTNTYETSHICPYHGYLTPWQGWNDYSGHIYPLIHSGLKYYSIYMDGEELPYQEAWTKTRYEGLPNVPIKYSDLVRVGDCFTSEDNGLAPEYTLDPDTLKSDGYPTSFYWRDFSNLKNRRVYVKVYHSEWSYKTIDPIYGYKNWSVEFKDGKYQRFIIKDGQRGILGVPNEEFGTYEMGFLAVPTYVEADNVFAPVDYDANAVTALEGNAFSGKWKYVWGWGEHLPPEPWHPYPILGTVVDNEPPPWTGRLVKKNWYDYDDPNAKNLKYIGNITLPQAYKLPHLKIEGNILPGRVDYFSGYPIDESPGFGDRNEPPYSGDRGFKLVGNVTLPLYTTALSFLYLQQVWDAYNTIHWSASLGYSTKIQLQYAEYITENTYHPYNDLVTTKTSFDTTVYMMLIKPLTWSAYLDTINPGVFKEGYVYKMRMRLVDPVSHTYSSYVYSSKFTISHNAVNPVNIISTVWEPWTKQLIITFRVDDSQGDNYDVYAVQYTEDGSTWKDIAMQDIEGSVTELISNKYGDSVQDIITHEVRWNATSYQLSNGKDYRVRFFATLSAMKQGSQSPVFEWSYYPNSIIKYAEIQLKIYLGAVQNDVYNEETQQWDHLTYPQLMPGKLDRNKKLTEDIKADPPPYGVTAFYEDHDITKPIIDMPGYIAWKNTLVGGISRAELLSSIESENKNIRDVILPRLYDQLDMGQMIVRRNLIKQGLYCNGYVNNIYSLIDTATSGVFRWQVESGPAVQPAIGVNYYDPRYEIYYRMQIDFKDTFDSQIGEKPLRDVFFDKNGDRLQNLTAQKINIIDKQTETTNYKYYDPNATGKPWTGGETTDSSVPQVEESREYTTMPYVKYSLPKTDLPGDRKDYFIDYSYPLVTDTLPTGIESFNYDYFMRSATYNIVTGTRNERERNIIKDLILIPNNNKIEFKLFACADESTNQLSIVYHDYLEQSIIKWEWSKENKAPVWENKEAVVFPTDRPTDEFGIIIPDDRINGNITIEGKERIRPSVVITSDHQYCMWYSKKNMYNENVVVQSLGKNWNTFGEYSVCSLMYANKSIKTLNVDSLYAPYVITDENDYYMWTTGVVDLVNKIYFSKSNKNLDVWSELILCTGLDGCYYPSILYEEGTFRMWCCKLDGGLSKIFYFTSPDGLNWSEQGVSYTTSNNLNSPCVIKVETGYIMYFTEYVGANSKIASVYSTDGITWTDYDVEINDDNTCHPMVLIDRYCGNNVYRMYYNQLIDGKYIVKTTVLEDRVWNIGKSISIATTLIPTIFGSEYEGLINISANDMGDLTIDSDIKIRLYYGNSSGIKNFYSQSEWRLGSDEDMTIYLNPNGKWLYSDVWKSVAYEGE